MASGARSGCAPCSCQFHAPMRSQRVITPDGSTGWRFSQSIEEAEEAKVRSESRETRKREPKKRQLPQAPAQKKTGSPSSRSKNGQPKTKNGLCDRA